MSKGDERADGAEWQSFADYRAVSHQVARAVDEAVAAFAEIESMHVEGVKVRDREAAQARARVQTAALMLLPELEQNADDYDELLARWTGERGFLQRLDDVSLRRSCPDWLEQFARDIREAGFRLGYLQAGEYEGGGAEFDDESLTDTILS